MSEEEENRKRKERSPEPQENTNKIARINVTPDGHPSNSILTAEMFSSQPPIVDQRSKPPVITLTCPCQARMKKTVYIRCCDCDRLWHTECVGLLGATVHLVGKLKNWSCPACFKLSEDMVNVLRESDVNVEFSQTQVDHVTDVVRKEIESIIPRLVNGVAEEIKDQKIKEVIDAAGQSVTKSWVEIAKTEQKNLIKQVVVASSETALQESMKAINSDLTERNKRKRNIIVSNIPENSEGHSLKVVICSALYDECAPEDILFCSRLGARGEKPRAVLVIMRREDDAVYFTNNGRGRCYFGQTRSDNVWVNPDLTRNEREAMFQERKERNEKRNRSERHGRGAINQPNGGVVSVVHQCRARRYHECSA